MRERFSRDTVLIPLGLFLLTVATRIPFTSKFLYHIDSVNYALALEHYDITVHQPHPLGYFLYVMLGRLFHLFINDANAALVAMSIVFSGLTVVAIYVIVLAGWPARSFIREVTSISLGSHTKEKFNALKFTRQE